jgi:agarase
VADRYFALTAAAIKAADPNHLVLGCRFAIPPPKPVIEAAGWHLDVISFNCYDSEPTAALDAYATVGKPCLIRLPNTDGAGPKVATQAERAAGFRRYVTRALHCRALVGYRWFEHADQPAEGRFDGENSNFGRVTIEDRVYDELTREMPAVNPEAEAMHSAAVAA